MNQYVNALKSLSDKTRLRIINVLLLSKKHLCICEIMDSLNVPQYTISKQVRELKIAGLIQENKAGRFVFYSLTKTVDEFHKLILKCISSIPKENFKDDVIRLKHRLALRKNGQCVIGMKNKRQ